MNESMNTLLPNRDCFVGEATDINASNVVLVETRKSTGTRPLGGGVEQRVWLKMGRSDDQTVPAKYTFCSMSLLKSVW